MNEAFRRWVEEYGQELTEAQRRLAWAAWRAAWALARVAPEEQD